MADLIYQNRFSQAGRVDAWHKKGLHFDVTSETSLVELGKESGLDYPIEVVPLTAQIVIPNPLYRPIDAAELAAMSLNDLIAAKQAQAQAETVTVSLPSGQNAIIMMPHVYGGEQQEARVLGTSSDRYVPVQNRWLLEAFEPVAKLYRPETMGVLKDGEIVFFTLNAGMFDVRVNGRDDAHNAYIYAIDRKTPGSVFTVGAGSTRIVCYNTMMAAEAAARIMIPIQHSKGIEDLIGEIAKALRGLSSAQEAQRQALQMMADRTIDAADVQNVFQIAWPTPKLSQTILSLDTLTNPVDSPNASQVDQIALAMSKVGAATIIKDKIAKAEADYVAKVEFVEYMRETAQSAFDHMAIDEGLGSNGYVAMNAVSETLEHRTKRTRGDSSADMLVGNRSVIMERVSKWLIDRARN